MNETVKALRSIEIQEEETTVPIQARPLLAELKHELRDSIIEILNQNASYISHLRNAENLQSVLMKELQHRGVPLDSMSEDAYYDERYPYGEILDVSLERPKVNSHLLAVTTSISIPYCADTSLYIFQEESLSWTLILAIEENNYASIRSAQCGLSYGISPPNENGEFFIATAHTTAWPVSNWQGLVYKIVRPSGDSVAPNVILNKDDSVFLGADTPYTVKASIDSVTLVFQTSSIDTDILVRPRILKFRVNGNSAIRIDPIGFDAQGFLEEWIDQPWNEVAKWRYAKTVQNVEVWHNLLHTADKDYSLTLQFVQPCGEDQRRWQIGLELEQRSDHKPPKYLLPDVIYFTVNKKDSDYFFSFIDYKRPAGCPGMQAPRIDYDFDALSR